MAKPKVKVIGISNDAKTKEVQQYLDKIAGLGMEKAAKTLTRAFSKDVKLNRFLAAEFDKGLALFVDVDRRNKILEILEGSGITSVEAKKALIIKICQSDIEAEVVAKHEEITDKGKLVLNAEQKKSLAEKLVKYKEFLTTRLMPGALDLAAYLCVTTTSTVKEPATPELEAAQA